MDVSQEALGLLHRSDLIDLHLDSFIWTRLFGYDLSKRHKGGPLGNRFFGHVDFPRAKEGGLTGGLWSITTNPFRSAVGRKKAFHENRALLLAEIAKAPADVALVKNLSEYHAARKAGKHAAFLTVQGGNALDEDLDAIESLPDDVISITLLHFTRSRIGTSSAPTPFRKRERGLTAFGREYVRTMNRKRCLVDLAHISREGFFDAVEVHDPSQPLLVTHTGVCGAHTHWRHLDDRQMKAIANTGGVIGIMFQKRFLAGFREDRGIECVFRHFDHAIQVVGEDFVAIGSDFDGMIEPPKGLDSCLDFPKLVQSMLNRGWSDTRIQKILGGNFLRALGQIRGN